MLSIRIGALLVLTLLAGCSLAHESTVLPDKLDPDQGMLVLVIDSNVPFQRLKFQRAGDVFETVGAMDIGTGRTIRFIQMPPGNYYWSRIEFATDFNYAQFVDFTHGSTDLAFTIRPGTVSYAGDLLIRGNVTGGWSILSQNYHVRLLNHSAMLLNDIDVAQRTFITKHGIAYTGKGVDRFFDYYDSLSAPTTKGGH